MEKNAKARLDTRSEKEAPSLRRASLYLAAGFEIPGTIIGGVVVGYFLDRYFDTSPWLVLGMTFTAFVGAWIRLVRWVRYFSKTNQ